MLKYSWIKDSEDLRDFKFTAAKAVKVILPSKVDLRKEHEIVYDQYNYGSCTANCIATAIDYSRIKAHLKPVQPSRFFIYYNERLLENSINEDAGAMLRSGMKVINNTGVCRETTWDYNPKNMFRKPTKKAYYWANQRKTIEYRRLNNANIKELKACLAEGNPFVFGFAVFSSFEYISVAATGIMKMPRPNEIFLGGHAVIAVGYDDVKKHFILRNSWGNEWGDKGHFYMPYQYITDTRLASDFWTITA